MFEDRQKVPLFGPETARSARYFSTICVTSHECAQAMWCGRIPQPCLQIWGHMKVKFRTQTTPALNLQDLELVRSQSPFISMEICCLVLEN